MTNGAFDALADSLRSVQPASGPVELAAKVASSLEGMSTAAITDMFAAMLSLQSARVLNEIDVPTFIEDLGRTMGSAKSESLKDVELLKQRIAVLLDIPSLALSAKASSIKREHQRVFLSAQSFSDIRPVFSEDREHPAAAVVLHQLKISYLESDTRKEMFVTLDDEDLSKLQKALARAQTKSKALAALIQSTNIIKLT